MADQENTLLYKTKGNSNPKDKPKVYFTCHPMDFTWCFTKICEDIFKTHDCAVYYTADMAAELTDENSLLDLERMNLFVIPVTCRLLSKPNRAMDFDFRFAVEKHIPVLPIMMESGIDDLYRQPDKFGELQYVDPYSRDPSEISYDEKLKKYLESILISDLLAQKVRKAFDAYIFLSYRKKDRKYANELMRMIHSDPELRNVAIWFDEFLTPGESFKENIGRMLDSSKLFTLLVTPSLLERPGGKPNFVMGEEYPAMKASGKEILPAEMEYTDKKALCSAYAGIPDCVNVRDHTAFRERYLDSIKRAAISESRNDPVHNYLIGLAYLNGIDVEINQNYARNLFEMAHEAGVIEATKQLSKMYTFGIGVDYNIYKAAEYEMIVLKKARESQSSLHDRKQLIQEICDMADICLSGKKDKAEPSPGKLLSIKDAIEYYREIVDLQEEIIKISGFQEGDARAMRQYLATLCRLLSSGGWRSWTHLSHKTVIDDCRKWVYYSTVLAQNSEVFEDIFQLRESGYTLLNELGCDDSDYESILKITIDAATETANHAEGTWGDLNLFIDILYNNGVCYYFYTKQYENVNHLLHYCYFALERFRTLPVQDLCASYKNIYEFRLRQISHKSIEVLYDLIKHPSDPKVDTLIRQMLNDVVQYYDHNDILMRDIWIPALKRLLKDKY